ncbi:tail fiber [uncultured Mediterranean phage uvMED]|nr:tail fiber [uncultured Mediterranean phage uvMED]
MTVSSLSVKNSYNGDNSTTSFAYTFPIHSTSELQVILRAANGTETVQTITTHYSIVDNGAAGGQVNFVTAPGTGIAVVLLRDTNLTQETDYISNDPFPAETHEAALDKLTLQQQELQEELNRAIKISRSNDIASSEITQTASTRAGKLLAFDANGDLEVSLDASSIATNATAAANSAASALSHKNDAETAKTAAETAKTAAESLLDNFDDRFLGAKTSNPTVDNDGDALTDGALYFDTTNNVMKVYDLSGTQWRQIQLSNSDQANVNLVAGQISPTNNISTLAAQNTNLTTLAGLNSEITTLAGISGLSSLAAASSAVTNVNNNLSSVQNFADVYRIASSAPTTSLNQGDLYFDTTANELKVYKNSGWAAAGSTVNGTANRFEYTATAGQTTFSGADNNSAVLAYDSGFCDIYLNGVKLANADFTATSGNSVVLAAGAAVNDILMIVAYGTFQLANISINDLTDTPSAIGSAGQALVVNGAGNALVYSNASSAEVYGFEKYYSGSTINITVTDSGGVFLIDGVAQQTLNLYEGNTYVFSYPSSHPFALSTTANGSHGGGSEYTTGVTRDTGANTLTYVVPSSAPQLYYYCTSHSNMGGTANTPVPANNSLRVVTTNQGADNISATEYDSFSDVLFSASGFVFSLNASGRLIATI